MLSSRSRVPAGPICAILTHRGRSGAGVGRFAGTHHPPCPGCRVSLGGRAARGPAGTHGPQGTGPTCRGSSRCTVTPALPLPWDAPGGKQERGLGAPASLAGRSGWALCRGSAKSRVLPAAGQGSTVQAAGRARPEKPAACRLCLRVSAPGPSHRSQSWPPVTPLVLGQGLGAGSGAGGGSPAPELRRSHRGFDSGNRTTPGG